jgi:uncharacterized protein (DUF58 family)
MQVTRRWWANVGLAVLLAVGAVVLARPLLLAGAAALGARLLVQQWHFARTATRLDTELKIAQGFDRTQVAVEEPVTGTLTVKRIDTTGTPVEVTVEADVPLSATGSDRSERRCVLAPEERETATTFAVAWPVAGQMEFDPPTVTVTDERRLFRTAFTARNTHPQTVTVRPPQPQSLHVGAGGTPETGVFGEHAGDEQSSGVEPETVREYAPGDPLRRIDWKATARSPDLYVRTFTERIEHEVAMFVDHRSEMGTGRPGETKLDYAEQVALAVLDRAEDDGDPIGLYAIGDNGVTSRRPPDATGGTYSSLRTEIHDLTPTRAVDPGEEDRPGGVSESETTSRATADVTPNDARKRTSALSADRSAFAETLRPFYSARQTYVQRIASRPLYAAVRAYLATGGPNRNLSPARTVILTDDTERAALREAVKIARQHSDHVLVFLTPSVLFEPAGLADVDDAYDRYVDFETFRRNLAGLDGVSAFEIAAGDWLATLQTTAANAPARGEP